MELSAQRAGALGHVGGMVPAALPHVVLRDLGGDQIRLSRQSEMLSNNGIKRPVWNPVPAVEK